MLIYCKLINNINNIDVLKCQGFKLYAGASGFGDPLVLRY